MTKPAEVSIIIPFFNGGNFIDGAFEQIERQTFRSVEVIIIDDGSRAKDAEKAQNACLRHGALYVRKDNGGPASARNRGAEHAAGRWTAFLDVDDHWLPKKLEQQYAVAESGHDLVLCDTQTIDQSGAVKVHNGYSRLGSSDSFGDHILGGRIHSFTSAIFVSTDAFRKIGGFNEKLRFWEDHLFLYRCVREMKCGYIDEPLSQRVIHNDSVSHPSRNLDVEELVERRRLFFNSVTALYPEVDTRPFVSQGLQSSAKMAVALGQRGKALKMSVRSFTTHATMKGIFFVGAVMATFLKKDLFQQWYPELRGQANKARDLDA